jgi:DNA polymerase-3 subunit gamma/tau
MAAFLGGITVYQALYRKWRPRCFDDVVGQVHITETLKRQIETDRLSHAYLFTGTRGTGKTSCAKILARAVNCERPVGGNPCNQCDSCLGIESGAILDVLELDAASNNGVDQVRALRDEAVYTPAAVKKRVYIIDEVHMLSTPAFNALLKILEEPPSHLMFILATTELHKVPATIKSRCQQFSFKRIQPTEIVKQLQFIAQKEGIILSDEGAILLARLAEGGLRDALSLLDQCIGSSLELKESDILQVLGLSGHLEIVNLMNFIVQGDSAGALQRIGALYQDGKDMGALLGELTTLVRDLLVRKAAPSGGDSLLTGGYEDAVLRTFSELLSSAELVQMLSVLQSATAELYHSSNRRTDVELCIIRLCEKHLSAAPENLVARISRLEKQLSENTIPCKPQKQVALPVQKSSEEIPPWDDVSSIKPKPTFPAKPEIPPEPLIPAKEIVASNQAIPTEDWKCFVSALRGKLPPSAYTFLGKTEFVSGIFDEQALRLYVDSDMTKTILGRPDVLHVLEQEAKTYTGRPLHVNLQVGKPEMKAIRSEPEDKLNDLLKLGKQFGNITIK